VCDVLGHWDKARSEWHIFAQQKLVTPTTRHAATSVVLACLYNEDRKSVVYFSAPNSRIMHVSHTEVVPFTGTVEWSVSDEFAKKYRKLYKELRVPPREGHPRSCRYAHPLLR